MLRIWQHILSLSYSAYASVYKFVYLICFFIFPYSSKSTKENITVAGLDWELHQNISNYLSFRRKICAE